MEKIRKLLYWKNIPLSNLRRQNPIPSYYMKIGMIIFIIVAKYQRIFIINSEQNFQSMTKYPNITQYYSHEM